MSRSSPNILLTGTPGVGKSKFAEILNSKLGLEVINIGQFARENNCLGDWDPEYESHDLKEDDLLDLLEERLGKGDGGFVVEHHVPEADNSDVVTYTYITHNTLLPLVNTEKSDWLSSCSRSAGLTWSWSSGATTLSSSTVSSPGSTQAGNWRRMFRQKYSKQFWTRRKRATGGRRILLSFWSFSEVVLEGRSW